MVRSLAEGPHDAGRTGRPAGRAHP
jgi:hypothetical protein